MKLAIQKREFAHVVARCQGVAQRKGAIPALACVLLDATERKLEVSATDLYLSVQSSASCEVTHEGRVAVPARELLERIKAMPEGLIHVEAKDASIVLKSGARRFTLRGISADEFPSLPTADATDAFTLDGRELSELIGGVQHAVSSDETRPALNCALLEVKGASVRMVATDGHRLALIINDKAASEADATALITLRALAEIRRFADEMVDSYDVSVAINAGSSAVFDFGSVRFFCKLVDGQFPPYMQVIPKNSPHTLTVDRAAFADALRAVSLASSAKTGGVRIDVTAGTLRVTSESPESGDAQDDMTADYTGPDGFLGVNARYVLDALASIASESVAVHFGGDLDPLVIQPHADSLAATFVVMPMRV